MVRMLQKKHSHWTSIQHDPGLPQCWEETKQGSVTEILQVECSEGAPVRRGGRSWDLLIQWGAKWRLLEQKSSKCSGQNTAKAAQKSPEAPTSSCDVRHHLSGDQQTSRPHKGSRMIIYSLLADTYPFLQIWIVLKRKLKHAEANEERPEETLLLQMWEVQARHWLKQLFSFLETSDSELQLPVRVNAHLATPPALPDLPDGRSLCQDSAVTRGEKRLGTWVTGIPWLSGNLSLHIPCPRGQPKWKRKRRGAVQATTRPLGKLTLRFT